jgi:hypothetical protein
VNRPNRPRVEALLAAAAGLCLLTGCRAVVEEPDEPIGFHLSSRRDVLRLRRVVFVELRPEGDCPSAICRDTTEALAHAVLDKRLFHVDIIREGDPMCRDLPLDRLGALEVQELAAIRKALNCHAVLFGRITHFQPHPRMKMGLHLKLLELRDGRLVWGIDHVWDTAERNVENRICRYFRREIRSGYEPLGPELVLKSPRAFERFVAYEVANTLPPRHLPPQPASGPGVAGGGAPAVARAGTAMSESAGKNDP